MQKYLSPICRITLRKNLYNTSTASWIIVRIAPKMNNSEITTRQITTALVHTQIRGNTYDRKAAAVLGLCGRRAVEDAGRLLCHTREIQTIEQTEKDRYRKT